MKPDLKTRLEAEARQSGRSLNAEIVTRLEASFAADDARSKLAVKRLLRSNLLGDADPIEAWKDDIEKRLAALEAKE
jgi:hypothetical protein